jgi:hypothetical protein
VPRKEPQQVTERPAYLTEDGTIDLNKVFKFQPRQTELLRPAVRKGGKVFTEPVAPQCLSVGGIRGGKTLGWLMYAVMNYCLVFEKCDILVLRRTFTELDGGAIHDATCGKFIPKEIFKYDTSRHILTFSNGSRIVFGHCEHNKERDLAQYLGQAYSFILVDECGQFSPDAWMRLYTRNTPNAGCEPDMFGNMPIPAMVGCTNPIGPFYEFYRTIFIMKEPWQAPEGARKDETNGTWWTNESGEWRLIYDPADYAYQRTTVLDNPELISRDPAILSRLNSLPKAKRDKELLGLDGKFEGQYFDVWSEDAHIVNLREDPEAIIWQPWQPVWLGQDWGMGSQTSGSANATYFFTKALVRYADTTDYKLKTVCFSEIVTTGGKTYKELASIIKSRCKLPDHEHTAFKPKAIHFSHEKFARQMDAHSPADDYSRTLRSLDLPGVTPGTRDRIGSASLLYNMLKNGEIVFLDTCKEIILAIPSMMRDPDELDDVLKIKGSKADDCYDACRLGLYGHMAARKQPTEDAVRDYAQELAKHDPMAAHFYLLRKAAEQANRTVTFKPPEQPVWMSKMAQPNQIQ